MQYFVEKYRSTLRRRPMADVCRFTVPFGGTLVRLDLYTPNISIGQWTFNVFINGVAQFSGVNRLIINADSNHAQKLGLAIDVDDGDVISLDLEEFGSGTLFPDIEFSAAIDDGGAGLEAIAVACSDDNTTAITTGQKATFRMPYGFTLTGFRASLSTASSSGNVEIDVKESGTTIFSTTPTIDSGEKTSTTAATPHVISDPALADDAEITVHVVAAGTGAKGLKVTLLGHK